MTKVDTEALLQRAREARNNAYIPYSGYAVGAALLTADGKIHTGCNVENATYPATICAERVALTGAVAEGQRDFEAMVIVTSNGGMPCGICRQVMYEFAPAMRVFIANDQGIVSEHILDDLLPGAFGPKSLLTR